MRQAAFFSDNNWLRPAEGFPIISKNYRQLLEIIVRENKPLAAKRRDIIV